MKCFECYFDGRPEAIVDRVNPDYTDMHFIVKTRVRM